MKNKILLITQECNPCWCSVPFVCFELCNAISKVADITIVTHNRNTKNLQDHLPNIEIISINESIFEVYWYKLCYWLSGKRKWWPLYHILTFPLQLLFINKTEMFMTNRIKNKEFDIVHTITPMIPHYPSPLVDLCNEKNIPLVIGPVNGGLPYPKYSKWIQFKEGGIFSWIKKYSHNLPSIKKTYNSSSKVLCGSIYTYDELTTIYPNISSKLEWMPENGIRDSEINTSITKNDKKTLKLCFAGRLVPYKGCDLIIESLNLLKTNSYDITLEIIGDGPERNKLQSLVKRYNLQHCITFYGNKDRDFVLDTFNESDMLVFPSRREFGGGVVMEAMAKGCVPIILAYGGPNEITNDDNSFKIHTFNHKEIVLKIKDILSSCHNELDKKKQYSLNNAKNYTWSRKAKRIKTIYEELLDE